MNIKKGFYSFIFLIFLLGKGLNGAISQGPLNSVSEIGKEVKLDCTADAPIAYWVLSKNGNTSGELTIVGPGCSVPHPAFVDHYAVEILDGGKTCNLVVSNITMEQAGVYRCQEGLVDSSSILTVLESSPVITVNSTTSIVENESVVIACTLNHNGSVIPAPTLQPYFYWMNSVGQNTSSSFDSTTNDTAVSQLRVIAGRQNITAYTCHVYLQLIPTTNPNYAGNTPAVSSSNSSSAIEVLYSPGDITITGGNCANEPEQTNLTCAADANPPAVYKWLDLANNITTSGSVVTITTDGEYECIATNCIRNQTHSGTLTANVTKCQKPISLAWIAIPIYVGLCWLLGILFALHYGKSKRKDIYDKRYPFLTKMLPCHNKDDSDDGNGCNLGWTVLYIVMVTFVGLFAIPVFFFTVQCSKAETKVSSSELKTADSQKM